MFFFHHSPQIQIFTTIREIQKSKTQQQKKWLFMKRRVNSSLFGLFFEGVRKGSYVELLVL